MRATLKNLTLDEYDEYDEYRDNQDGFAAVCVSGMKRLWEVPGRPGHIEMLFSTTKLGKDDLAVDVRRTQPCQSAPDDYEYRPVGRSRWSHLLWGMETFLDANFSDYITEKGSRFYVRLTYWD